MTAGWRSEARARLDAGLYCYGPKSDAAVDLGRALDALDAVLALHQPDTFGDCRVCVDAIFPGETYMEPWPCPTVRAIEGDDR